MATRAESRKMNTIVAKDKPHSNNFLDRLKQGEEFYAYLSTFGLPFYIGIVKSVGDVNAAIAERAARSGCNSMVFELHLGKTVQCMINKSVETFTFELSLSINQRKQRT